MGKDNGVRPSNSHGVMLRRAAAASAILLLMATDACAPHAPRLDRHAWTVPGSLRIGMSQMPNSLDPVLRTLAAEGFLSQFVFDSLVATRVDGVLEPKLATVVPTHTNGGISRDGLTITYRLRPHVRWHDGAPCTSTDVRFTYLAYMNPNNNVSLRTGYEDIARVDTPDALTVVVHLARKSAPFVQEFTDRIIPAHAFVGPGALNTAAFNAAPIGTGPFKIIRWQRGERIEYVANEDYAFGRPKLRKIVVSFLPNEIAAANALRAHGIDWLWAPSTLTYHQLREVPTLHSALILSNAFFGLMMNAAHPPLDDRRIRQAISAAIDRDERVKKVAFGAAQAADADQPSFLWTHDPTFHGQRYDLGRARMLLREAGWSRHSGGTLEKNGKPLAFLMVFSSGNATAEAIAVQLQARLHDLGIAVELKSVSPNLLFASYAQRGINARGAFDLNLSQFYQSDDPDNQTTFACRNVPPHGFTLHDIATRPSTQPKRSQFHHTTGKCVNARTRALNVSSRTTRRGRSFGGNAYRRSTTRTSLATKCDRGSDHSTLKRGRSAPCEGGVLELRWHAAYHGRGCMNKVVLLGESTKPSWRAFVHNWPLGMGGAQSPSPSSGEAYTLLPDDRIRRPIAIGSAYIFALRC